MTKLMTIAEVAKELKIPESTARYYRDNFINYIPFVGEGRKKRYRPETVNVLRFIADGFKRKLTAMEIEDGLSQLFPRNMDDEQPTATSAAVVQQQSENDSNPAAYQLQNALEQMNATMQVIADQKEEIAELREHIAGIEKKQQQQEDSIHHQLNERDQKLMASLKSVQEEKEAHLEAAATAESRKKKSWWEKLFSKEKEPPTKP